MGEHEHEARIKESFDFVLYLNPPRAKVGDLVAEANGHSLLCLSQQEALQRINESGKTVRLKLGRSLAATTHLHAPPPATENLTEVCRPSVP